VFSGSRASELRARTWPNVEFIGDNKVIIKVRQRADRWNKIEEVTKSKSSNRDVEIVVLYAINTLKAWRDISPKGSRNLVFPNSKGNVETLPTIHNRGLAPLQRGGRHQVDDEGLEIRNAQPAACRGVTVDRSRV
jgi:hypothetical protein